MISCLKNANLCFKKTVQGPSALSLSYSGDPAVKVYVTTMIPLMLNDLKVNLSHNRPLTLFEVLNKCWQLAKK